MLNNPLHLRISEHSRIQVNKQVKIILLYACSSMFLPISPSRFLPNGGVEGGVFYDLIA